MFLFQVKRWKESRQRHEYYSLLSTSPGDKAYHPLPASEWPWVNVPNE